MKKKITTKKKKGAAKKAVVKRRDDSVQIALDTLSAGYNTDEAIRKVTDYRRANKLSILPQTVINLVSKANIQLSNEFGKDKEHVIALHVERYNKEIKSILELDNPFLREREIEQDIISRSGHKNQSPEEIKELVNDMMEQAFGERDYEALAKLKLSLISRYYEALGCMFAKERVLQMHSKKFQIVISNKLNIDVKEEKKSYKLDKLTFEQKVDFLNLILKAKKNDFEAGSVILRENKEQQEIIDIQHEVIQEVPNIELIKHEPKAITAPSQNGTAVLDVNAKLAETFKRRAEEAFKKAGSKKPV